MVAVDLDRHEPRDQVVARVVAAVLHQLAQVLMNSSHARAVRAPLVVDLAGLWAHVDDRGPVLVPGVVVEGHPEQRADDVLGDG
jgi:hypothetical protein